MGWPQGRRASPVAEHGSQGASFVAGGRGAGCASPSSAPFPVSPSGWEAATRCGQPSDSPLPCTWVSVHVCVSVSGDRVAV